MNIHVVKNNNKNTIAYSDVAFVRVEVVYHQSINSCAHILIPTLETDFFAYSSAICLQYSIIYC